MHTRGPGKPQKVADPDLRRIGDHCNVLTSVRRLRTLSRVIHRPLEAAAELQPVSADAYFLIREQRG